jgi:hypothetical protein
VALSARLSSTAADLSWKRFERIPRWRRHLSLIGAATDLTVLPNLPVGPRRYRRGPNPIAARGIHEQRHTPAAGDPMSLTE